MSAPSPLSLLQRSDRAAFRAALNALGTELALSEVPPLTASGPADVAAEIDERAWLVAEGHAFVPRVVEPTLSNALRAAIARLLDEGLPAVFLYAYDEPWTLGARVRDRVAALVGAPYALAADVWAWSITPGLGRGWPPHRGTASTLDREAPELVNAWVALSDATPERACLHVVPLGDDPAYPAHLEQTSAPLGAVRAVPLAEGDALAWNANVLHWGGPCSPRAKGPRVSCSFSLVREGAGGDAGLAPAGVPTATLDELTFDRRLDLIARMITTYGRGEPDVNETVAAWATATTALAQLTSER